MSFSHRRKRPGDNRRPRIMDASNAARRPAGRRLRPLAEALEARTLLSTYTVDHFVDENDGNIGAGNLSLREAILLANANPGEDQITIPAGTYRLAIAGANEDAGLTGDLDITDSVQISGAGIGATTINGAGLDRVFQIVGTFRATDNPVVSISGMTITGGQTPNSTGTIHGGGIQNSNSTLTLDTCSITGNATGTGYAGGRGGGVNVDGGTLTITNSVIDGNTTGNGSAQGGDGGGVGGNASTITIQDSFVRNNRTGVATGSAGTITAGRGGLYSSSGEPSYPGTLTVTNTQVLGNATGDAVTTVSKGLGGGIYNYSGSALYLTGSTVANNTAYQGGGVMTDNGTDGEIIDSSITNNTANGGRGGGLYVATSLLSMISGTTISGNTVTNAGLFRRRRRNLYQCACVRHHPAQDRPDRQLDDRQQHRQREGLRKLGLRQWRRDLQLGPDRRDPEHDHRQQRGEDGGRPLPRALQQLHADHRRDDQHHHRQQHRPDRRG